jgi:hemoglobin
MNADADLGPRFVNCFVQAADDAGLPADQEFRDELRAYMEWAVRDIYAYNTPGSAVPQNAVIPRWGWDGLEP